jgi:selenophosphate synthetase-related protein
MDSGASHDQTLEELAAELRDHRGLRAKSGIRLVSEVIGGGNWVDGPGDDGAVVALCDSVDRRATGHVIACGEAVLPAFVAADPFAAGIAAVLTNVNDLAAMGATPLGIVDTIVGSADVARQALRGMKEACEWYDVRLVGGHLTLQDGVPAISAFGIGHADSVLSSTRVASGQSLIVAACTEGSMRPDFPFFSSVSIRGSELAADVRVLRSLAVSGACVAAKDVSMAGFVGSLAMLLEWSRLGVVVDLNAMPRPADVPMRDWLMCFPAYAFLLCVPQAREAECAAAFHARGLHASVVGTIEASGVLAIRSGQRQATVLDLMASDVTGLAR